LALPLLDVRARLAQLSQIVGNAVAFLVSKVLDIVEPRGAISEDGRGNHGQHAVREFVAVEFAALKLAVASYVHDIVIMRKGYAHHAKHVHDGALALLALLNQTMNDDIGLRHGSSGQYRS